MSVPCSHSQIAIDTRTTGWYDAVRLDGTEFRGIGCVARCVECGEERLAMNATAEDPCESTHRRDSHDSNVARARDLIPTLPTEPLQR